MAGPHLLDSMSAVQAATPGQGIIIVSRLLVVDAIGADLLVQPFADTLERGAYHYAVAADLAASDTVGALRA